MKTKVLLIILLFSFTFLHAQKEAANWFFGEFAGLDFNNGSPIGQFGMLDTREGCASISDRKGNLLFYTDGTTVFDRRHEIMLNGTELLGNNSSTQSAIIVPKPESNSIYYIFTVDSAELSDASEINHGLNYTIIDMNLNNGYGDVVGLSKNKHLITYNTNDEDQVKWKCSEKITAVLDENEESYWVVTHFIDTFYAFRVDETGVLEEPVKTKTNEVINPVEFFEIGSHVANISALGYLKISPNGEKLAIAHSSTFDSKLSGKAFLYDFNDSSGKVSTSGKILLENAFPYGLEFSPKSKKLYLTTNKFIPVRDKDKPGDLTFKFENSSLYQYDLKNADVKSSRTLINQTSKILAGALQLGIDGKIYRAKYDIVERTGISSLAGINKPELSGDNCDYQDKAVSLMPDTFSRYGLPPFVASIFKFTFDYEYTCLGNNTHFFVPNEDSYTAVWDFGDGTPTSSEKEPYHVFENPGKYTVKLIITIDGIEEEPITKKVTIFDTVETMEDTYNYIECDSNDENASDGITTFNLQLANDPISLGNGDSVDVYYYNDVTTLNNDPDNILSLPNFYTNTMRDEIVHAKIVKSGSDCFGIGQVRLTATETKEFTSIDLTGCYLSNGEAQFDLSSDNEIISSNLNLEIDADVSFHLTKDNASLGYEPLDQNYISESKTIYIRIEKEGICYGISELNLEISSPPNIDLYEEFNICESILPFKINVGMSLGEINNYLYQWDSGQDSHEIDIFDVGEYQVIITNKITLCNYIKNIKVNIIKKPVIEKIEIQDDITSYTAIIQVDEGSDFLYSLNDDFGIHRNDPTFTNLTPGTYTAYVTDKNNCNIIEKQFYIFGFPKFFTPNNDGQNDYWEVKGLDFDEYTYSSVYIFNRFGKHLATVQPGSYWDGIYNGKYLPQDDYWFSVSITDKQNITNIHKGHFSLLYQ